MSNDLIHAVREETVRVRTVIASIALSPLAVEEAMHRGHAYRENGSQYRVVLVVPYVQMGVARRIAEQLNIYVRADRDAVEEDGWALDILPPADELRTLKQARLLIGV